MPRFSQMIISIGTTFDIIFVTVSLKMETCSLTSKSVSAESYSDKLAALFIWSEFAWELHMPYSSLIRRWIKTFKSNFAKLIWWWHWGWRKACTPESITILDWNVNNKSIQELEFSNVGNSLIVSLSQSLQKLSSGGVLWKRLS